MTLLYFSVEAYNTKKILESFKQNISFLKSLKFTMIGFFFSSITPASSGGQPMQIYYMAKEKINVSHSTMALLINLCGYLISTIFIGILCAIFNPEIISGKLFYLFIIGTLFNAISLTFTSIGIFSKNLSLKIIKVIISILKFFKFKKIDKIQKTLYKELDLLLHPLNTQRKLLKFQLVFSFKAT